MLFLPTALAPRKAGYPDPYDASRSLRKEHRSSLSDIDGSNPVPKQVLKSSEICLQIINEQNFVGKPKETNCEAW